MFSRDGARSFLSRSAILKRIHAVMILNFRTDRSEQTVESQIRSGFALFAILSAYFGCITLWKATWFEF